MRALLIPQVVGGELTAESDFYGYRQIMEMLPKYEPSFCYLWVRGRDENVPRLWPNVEVFAEATQSQTFYQQMVAVTGRLFEMFNRISGPYPVDAVFTSRAGLVPALMLGLATTAEQPVPVVLLEPRVYAPGSVSHNNVTWLDSAARSLGYAMAFGAYWSEHERDEAFRCIEAWLSPAALQEAKDRAFVIPYVVDVPIDALDRRKKGPVWSVAEAGLHKKRLLFCGRLNANKKFETVIRAYGKVLMGREDVDVLPRAPGDGECRGVRVAGRRCERNRARDAQLGNRDGAAGPAMGSQTVPRRRVPVHVQGREGAAGAPRLAAGS